MPGTHFQSKSKNLQDTANEELMRDFTIQLGEKAYIELSDEEQKKLHSFIWAGCSMHKDLNSVKGGNSAMISWWTETRTPGPILLVNKDNSLVFEKVSADTDILSPTEQYASDVTTCDGVKTASIAKALFNNKDDKSWFEEFNGGFVSFPDTNNTHYQSHCAAAAELVTLLDKYLEFLEFVYDAKAKQNFNHIEEICTGH